MRLTSGWGYGSEEMVAGVGPISKRRGWKSPLLWERLCRTLALTQLSHGLHFRQRGDLGFIHISGVYFRERVDGRKETGKQNRIPPLSLRVHRVSKSDPRRERLLAFVPEPPAHVGAELEHLSHLCLKPLDPISIDDPLMPPLRDPVIVDKASRSLE